MKRFYTDVTVSDDRSILLDGRIVRTPAKAVLTCPNKAIADAAATEWRAQDKEIDPRSMPITGFANAAIDRIAPDPQSFAAQIARYAETELLCYRADGPAPLIARQQEIWDPLLAWAKRTYGVRFTLVTGVMHQSQPRETIMRLAEIVAHLDAFELAAFAQLTTISGSIVVPLALSRDVISADAAFDASHLDELWQAEQWGEDSLATDARALRRRDFRDASRFLGLYRSA